MRKVFVFLIPFLFFISCTFTNNKISLKESIGNKKKWVFLVYMASDNELESYGIQDINEMEAAIEDKGNVDVYVLCDRIPGYDGTNKNWNDTKLFQIKHDREGMNGTIISNVIDCPELDLYDKQSVELDMGNPHVLSSYVESIKKRDPAENYGLIIWGHGSGWRGYSVDDSSSSSMSLPDLRESLKNSEIDCLVFDTCFGLTMETLYELKESVNLIIGTPGINPVNGLDYEKFLKQFSKSEMLLNDVSLCVSEAADVPFFSFEKNEIESLYDTFDRLSGLIAENIQNEESRKNVDQKFKNEVLSYHSQNYPCDLFIEIGSAAEKFQELEKDETDSPCTDIKNILGNRKVSVHYVPLVSSNVTASAHSGLYWHENSDSENVEKCFFVKKGGNWVPGNSKESLLDKLFYTSF